MMVGRITKDNADRRRIVVDFAILQWLDPGEIIASYTTPVVVVEQVLVQTNPYVTTLPSTPPVDTTPLVVNDVAIIANGTQVQMYAEQGTPGLTYKVTFTVTGNTSTRIKQVDILVLVRMPV